MKSELPQSLGILSIATGIYKDYWIKLFESIVETWASVEKISMHVFTDDPDGLQEVGETSPRVKVVSHPIPSFGWPEATLLRYSIFKEKMDQITEDVLLYLDADMQVVGDLPTNWLNYVQDSVTLVAHPGYFRPASATARAGYYFRNPIQYFLDVWALSREGGLGEWEKNPASQAYVRKADRITYVCGGAWFGPRDKIMEMIETLSGRVELDYAKNVTARWHDESHLNWYFADSSPALTAPSWCYVEGASNLKGITPIVLAVDKGDHKTR